MNRGLLGFPSATRPGIEATYTAYAVTPYTVATEPVSDTAVLGDDLATPLTLRFWLPAVRTVQIRLTGALVKGDAGHTVRCSLYDNGTKVAPSTSLSTNGWHSYSEVAGADQFEHVQFDAMLSLGAGAHAIDWRRNAVTGTSYTQFGFRVLVAEVLAP